MAKELDVWMSYRIDDHIWKYFAKIITWPYIRIWSMITYRDDSKNDTHFG